MSSSQCYDRLTPDRTFLVTVYYTRRESEMIIINTLSGQSLVIQNPCNTYSFSGIALLTRKHGVCSPNGFICRAIYNPKIIKGVILEPNNKSEMNTYYKVMDFLSQ